MGAENFLPYRSIVNLSFIRAFNTARFSFQILDAYLHLSARYIQVDRKYFPVIS